MTSRYHRSDHVLPKFPVASKQTLLQLQPLDDSNESPLFRRRQVSPHHHHGNSSERRGADDSAMRGGVAAAAAGGGGGGKSALKRNTGSKQTQLLPG